MRPCLKNRMTHFLASQKQAWFGVLALVAIASLSACGKQASTEDQAGHALPLARVNDVEIIMLQTADDLAPAEGRPIATKEAVNKNMLEMLIDRQLLREEAIRNKLDRDPQVLQAIDHAKTQILAQAYLQSKFASTDTPSKAEVDAYFQAHPELFTQRKVFYMKELVIATKDFSMQLNARLNSADSIEEVAAWLDQNHVHYEQTQLSRSTADLAPEMIMKLQTMRKNQLFVIKAGEYTMLDAIDDVRLSPVAAEVAAPQIERYLRNKKHKEISDRELGRLRALAKIEYFNKTQFTSATPPAAKMTDAPAAIEIAHGMTGFK